MSRVNRFQADALRLSTRRYRRLLVAAAVTLATSTSLLGLIGFMQWRGRQALRSDTRAVVAQTAQQLLRGIQSRRGALTLLRDTLRRRPALTPAALRALGSSSVEHTRHLIGIGSAQAGQDPVWWAHRNLSQAEFRQLGLAIRQRLRLAGVWGVPSTLVVTTRGQRPLLLMLEPVPGSSPSIAIAGCFDLAPFLQDFFASTPAQRYPAQVFDDQRLLYRSADWTLERRDRQPVIVEAPVRIDAARWTLQMQPGRTGIARTLSWANVLLAGLSLIAGLGITGIVWMLAARTWILQRAVAKRTAALRRALSRVRQMAVTDELTGLYNRRFFLRRLEWEWARAKRYQRPLTCLMIDVNNFKDVNDRLGHPVGDLVLQQVARELRTLLRQSDILARLGGDEFVAALPETSEAQAAQVAEKLRRVGIRLPDAPLQRLGDVTLSVGASHVTPQDASCQDVLDAADRALYAHKRRLKAGPSAPATHDAPHA
jgi:diguanylate cyclase (GGDEF)-like protein